VYSVHKQITWGNEWQ